MDCLDNIRLDIFVFFESNGCAIYKLSFPVLGDGRSWGRLRRALLNFSWKECYSFNNVSQHELWYKLIDKTWNLINLSQIKYQCIDCPDKNTI